MYAMDFRHYMPDIGRFTGIDRLSELAPELNSYRFGFNNPILYNDPTGLFESRREAREYRREHELTGSITRNKDGSYSINDKQNGVSYTRGTEGSQENFMGDGVQESVLLVANAKTSESNVVSSGKTINDYSGLALAPVEAIPGSFRLTNGAYNGSQFSPKYYSSGWTGGSRARITTYNIGKVGKGLGVLGLGVGTILDYKGVQNYKNPKIGPNSPNSVHPAKARMNFAMGAYGVLINPIPSLVYSGVDTLYPGGWAGDAQNQGAIKDVSQQIEANQQVIPGFNIYRDF